MDLLGEKRGIEVNAIEYFARLAQGHVSSIQSATISLNSHPDFENLDLLYHFFKKLWNEKIVKFKPVVQIRENVLLTPSTFIISAIGRHAHFLFSLKFGMNVSSAVLHKPCSLLKVGWLMEQMNL